MTNRYTALMALSAAALCLVGCSHEQTQTASSAVTNGIKVVDKEATKMGAQASPDLKKLDLGLRVTTALRANANLPDTIRVDANVNGVRLRGTVENAHQKALAGKIAKETVPAGKSVTNELTVKAA